jgi:hypothetical protein
MKKLVICVALASFLAACASEKPKAPEAPPPTASCRESAGTSSGSGSCTGTRG